MPLGIFRKRKKTRLADGTKVVTVTDRKGTVRKQKIVRPSGIKEKQKYNKAGDLHTAKLKGPGIRRTKLDVKNSSVTLGKSQGYQWASNPNKKSAPKTTPKKKLKNTSKINAKIVDNKSTPTNKTITTNKTTNNKTNNKTTPNKTTKKSQTFKEAFRTNKDAGKKEFTWNNKKYHTKTKDELDAAKKKLNQQTQKKNTTVTSKTYDKSSKSYDHIESIEPQKQTVTKKKTNTPKKNTTQKKDNQDIYKRKTHTKNHVPIIMGPKFKKGGHVKGIGRWAGKNVPGMRYD